LKLRNLRLINFKNHKNSSWEFINNINCFVGNNGCGKTNILDAIHYLSFSKSYFNSQDPYSVNFDSDFFTIKGGFEKQDMISEIICNFSTNSGKSLKINDKKYKRFSDHIGSFPVILISPTDTNLIIEGGDTRRRYINSGISQFNDNYLKDLILYRKALKNRNVLLRKFKDNQLFDNSTLSIYDNILSTHAISIFNERNNYLEKLMPVFQKYYNLISENKELVGIEYVSSIKNNNFLEQLKESIRLDRISCRTSVGIHKDDLVFTLNGYPIKRHGSQGQQKSFLISLKLAQFEFIKQRLNICPILLLDDIFDKLDDSRVESLVSLVKNGLFEQVFITDTNFDRSNSILRKTDLKYSVFKL
tara:strand:- start:1075 stop:2154 length:1080 start_codon:yes stop_codon:yes gene_type:complete